MANLIDPSLITEMDAFARNGHGTVVAWHIVALARRTCPMASRALLFQPNRAVRVSQQGESHRGRSSTSTDRVQVEGIHHGHALAMVSMLRVLS